MTRSLFCAVPFTALLAAALLSPLVAHAAPSVFIDELTTTEVSAALQAGKTTLIIPVGGTEQSGPHVALGKHNARVGVLAERIALQLGDALVARSWLMCLKATSPHRPSTCALRAPFPFRTQPSKAC